MRREREKMNNPAALGMEIRLNRDEIIWLMDTLGAPTLFGVDIRGTQKTKPDLNKVVASLEKKSVLARQGKKEAEVNPESRSILNTLLFPDRALIVYRDVPGSGRQFFHVLHKEKTTVLHSFPKPGEHLIVSIPQPVGILPLIIGWFPFFSLPVAPVLFRIDRRAFQQGRNLTP